MVGTASRYYASITGLFLNDVCISGVNSVKDIRGTISLAFDITIHATGIYLNVPYSWKSPVFFFSINLYKDFYFSKKKKCIFIALKKEETHKCYWTGSSVSPLGAALLLLLLIIIIIITLIYFVRYVFYYRIYSIGFLFHKVSDNFWENARRSRQTTSALPVTRIIIMLCNGKLWIQIISFVWL